MTISSSLEDSLKPLIDAGVFRTTGDAILQGGRILSYLADQANDGFDEVIVRNDVSAERRIVLPELKTITRLKGEC